MIGLRTLSRGSGTALRTKRFISSSNLKVTKTTTPAEKPNPQDLVFGKTFTDHMLCIQYKDSSWQTPEIIPYQNLTISPAATALHYGLQCFEGMKAYNCDDGTIRLFRPEKNMDRLSKSMERLQMPGFDFDKIELQKLIMELVKLDREWAPKGKGYSLYIRPTVIATHPYLGLAAPTELLLYVILSPVGPYYKSGSFKPVRLTADTEYIRAWPGGTGSSKVGGNYAGTMKASYDNPDFDQVLWLREDRVTEVGSMNVFFVIDDVLITAPLDGGDILPGVTRDSILYLARSWGLTVEERYPTMTEVAEASKAGTLQEAFGAGTAAVVTPISTIQYNGDLIEIPTVGPVTQKVYNALTDIQYGKVDGPDNWSVVVL